MTNTNYIHRDINWCEFNARVLAEAADTNVPLLERIKFLAIFSSNLDEFFRVKVAALRKLKALKEVKANKWLGYSPNEVLEEIYAKVGVQQHAFGKIWRNEILPALEKERAHLYQTDQVLMQHLPEIQDYFRVYVQGHLNIIITKQHKKIELKNGGIYLVCALKRADSGASAVGYVNIPSTQLDRYRPLSPLGDIDYYITLDDVVRMNLPYLFKEYDIQGEAYSIKMNRDEDYEIEDEFSGNLVDKIKEKINKRAEGDPVRFLYDAAMPKDLLDSVQTCCKIPTDGIIEGGRYHNLNNLFQLAELLSGHFKTQKLSPIAHAELAKVDSVLRAMETKDYLLHFPYHRYDPVLRFFNEAAVDPRVIEIKVTLYRISKKSLIAQSLITAALNGKKVIVFVEVKARYDELNNLLWAKEMEKAGITIIYSIPGLKVHAKVAMVVRRDDHGKKRRYAYLATGNFNEKTALVYGDHGLLTTSKRITKELEGLFKFLTTQSKSIKFDHLLVAGFNMKQRLLEWIDNEIAAATDGKEAFIIVKINGLDEEEMIEKLYEASRAGVKIQLIVRAGCSLVPGRKGVSENITANRLIDMYLEHARVYWFCNNGKDKIYLSSADWMNRNLNRRIEVGFPLADGELMDEIKTIINLQLADQVKLTPVSSSQPITDGVGEMNTRAQVAIYQWLVQKEQSLRIS